MAFDPEAEEADSEKIQRGLVHFHAFQYIVDDMRTYYGHLLDDREHEVIDKVDRLSGPAKILLVRIFDRNYKNNQYMSHKLSHYLPEKEFGPAMEELHRMGFINITTEASLDAFEQLNGEQRGRILQKFRLGTNGNKSEQVARMQKHLKASKRQMVLYQDTNLNILMVKHIEGVHGGSHFIVPHVNAVFLLLYKLFYLDDSLDEDKYKRVYLSRTGMQRYPGYEVNREGIMLFETRQKAEEYFDCLQEYMIWEVRNNDGPWVALNERELSYRVQSVMQECQRILAPDYRPPHLPQYLLKYTPDRVRIRTLLRVREAMATPKLKNPQLEQKLIDLFLNQRHYCPEKRLEMFARKIELARAQFRKLTAHAVDEDKKTKTLEELRDLCILAVEEYDPSVPDSLDVFVKLKPVTSLLTKHQVSFPWDIKSLQPSIVLPEETVIVGEKFKEVEVIEEPAPPPQPAPPAKPKRKLNPNQSKIHSFFTVAKKPSSSSLTETAAQKEASLPQQPIAVRADWLTEDGQRRITVEEVALRHYEKLGYKGWHCEGKTIKTVCTLLFYDIFFKNDIPGVFYHCCQTSPLDFGYGTDFYNNRKQQVDDRLARLNNDLDQALVVLEEAYNALHEFTPLVDGLKLRKEDDELEDFKAIVRYMGSGTICEICKRLFIDNRRYGSGLPDLFLINHSLQTCLFVEVKSINDSLSNTQKYWLDFLTRNNVPVSVCRVLSKEEHAEREQKLAKKTQVDQENKRKREEKTPPKRKRRPKVEAVIIPEDADLIHPV
ncbi:hypothetical protein TRICI_000593 [Trichomonascus ciferrii]|uniref:Fanconi-associated nuclease n=1 Tax=Trichomonascus ciferrii TaxID=44093 RepID=A0A642VCX2_9ASCO|nr:hypothetical protein TRICI_000593 [Trichomonascus ciferrii]